MNIYRMFFFGTLFFLGVHAAPELKPGAAAEELRSFKLHSTFPLRDSLPAGGVMSFTEHQADPHLYSGNSLFDAIHALACHEARLNAVDHIHDNAYNHGECIELQAFQTGEKWNYVWTRDTSYSAALGLAALDPERVWSSLRFKTSELKPGFIGGAQHQIVQDTGSGGSWPTSSDRVVWALGVRELLKFIPLERAEVVSQQAAEILESTLSQDEIVLQDKKDGLFRGEQSFLDWREQSYPLWTKDSVGTIAASKSLSVNVAFVIAMETTASLLLAKNPSRAEQWTRKALALRESIKQHFLDHSSGQYSAYLLRGRFHEYRSTRLDLLGISLAILEGIPGAQEARKMLSSYPIGPHGPPVMSPQDLDVPIYHNSAIWPFVTAFWTKAAALAGHAEAVHAGIKSIVRGAGQNLSHMENLDFVSGASLAQHSGIEGPVINSRRQLWSVAGALDIIHSVIFGMEAHSQGIRFTPRLPAQTAALFNQSSPELRQFKYRGKSITVTLELPLLKPETAGFLVVEQRILNGKEIADVFISSRQLEVQNLLVIRLGLPAVEPQAPLRNISPISNFGPRPPRWKDKGIILERGNTVLNYTHERAREMEFSILKDGNPVARTEELSWTEPFNDGVLHEYSVEAVSKLNQLHSHPLPPVHHQLVERLQIITDFLGATEASLGSFKARVKGRPPLKKLFDLRFKYANGGGPISTGISCGIKRLDICEAGSTHIIASEYVVFPQTGSWDTQDYTTSIRLLLDSHQSYDMWLREDEWSRNMSYLSHNFSYTAHAGGGALASNKIRLFSAELLQIDP